MTSPRDETLKATPKAKVSYLVYSQADRATVRVALEPDAEVTFGRSADVTVPLDDPRVSRRHAVVQSTSSGVFVRDLGSSNGTLVRGEVLHGAARRVGAGDVIEIGPLRAVVVSASAQLVVADPGMRKLLAAVLRGARREAPVLLLGEPGVGKKTIAEQIHDASPRADAPFVVFRCGAVPEAAVEEAIFGAPGGVLETADRGTVLLSDVEHLSRGAQERLLHLLNAQASAPGPRRAAGAAARILCTSSEDLRAAVDAGTFDARLYARVATLAIRVPPLRERRAEIPVLAEHLLRQIAEPLGLAAPTLTSEAARRLCDHPWPRNVSDLRDVMEYALALSEDGTVGPSALPVSFGDANREAEPPAAVPPGLRVVLRMATDGDSFCLPPSAPVSLSRRGTLRRVLVRLARAHEEESGRALDADELFAAGWPGEKPLAQSADGRVRTAIWMLRRMGLHDRLVTRDDGYLLRDDLTIEWER